MTPQEMRDWRKRMGWTQERAAEMLGVHLTTIARYETMKRKIPRTVHLLCGALAARATGCESLLGARLKRARRAQDNEDND